MTARTGQRSHPGKDPTKTLVSVTPKVPRHPRARDGAARSEDPTPGPSGSVPSAEALRPFARALVALAVGVRADALATGAPWRSDGPRSKGGRPCEP
jgi:hypothetical protein